MLCRPLLLLLLLATAACGERPTLLIQLQHPSSLDPAATSGTLAVAVLRADTGELVDEQEVPTAGLGSRQRLFEGLDLEQGERYQLRLQLSFESAEAVCVAGGRRAVGLSPPFVYGSQTEQIAAYLDCADGSSDTGTPVTRRLYHTASLLPAPAPYGQVLLTGGADPSTNLEQPDVASLLDSLERFDPATGQFVPESGKLSTPRMLHQAVVDAAGDVLVAGGLAHKSGTVVPVKSVERIRDGRSASLSEMAAARIYHGAAMVGGKLVLVGGMASIVPLDVLKAVEVYDPTGNAPPGSAEMTLPRLSMAIVPLADNRRLLVSGGVRVAGLDLPDELVCLEGSCACGKPPCAETLGATGFGQGVGRYGVTGTRVDCPSQPGQGAIYLVGGSYEESTTKEQHIFDDIFCVDAASPSAPKRVGNLKLARVGHSTTLIRGPGGKQRLLVAGGSGKKTGGEGTVWDTAELVEVSCRCDSIAQITLVKLRGQRTLHSATWLPDGTVLIAGGVVFGPGAERFNPDL